MITLFSIPKAFTGPIRQIQINSINSWLEVYPEAEIILCGDEDGIKQMADSHARIKQLANIKKNQQQTPIVSDIFEQVQQLAAGGIICYVAGDIILMPNFRAAVKKLMTRQDYFAIGRRTDCDLNELIDFNQPAWYQNIERKLNETGALHGYSAMDLMLFPKNLPLELPPFLIGRPGWDNALVYQLVKRKIDIIDVTPAITAVHQNHDYSHHRQGKYGVWKGAEAQYNFRLAGGLGKMMSLRAANFQLTPRGLRPSDFSHKIYVWTLLCPVSRFLFLLKRKLHKIFK